MKLSTSLFTLLMTHPSITALAAMDYMNEIKIMEGHTKKHHILSPLPHT